MKNVITIAKNTLRETIRDRILYGILAFALLFLISTVFFGSISLGEDIRVIKDFGLAGIYIFSIIITIFLGSSLIYKEIEKRTIYMIFSKKITAGEFIVGKYAGLFVSLIINVLLMTIVYLIIVAVKGGGFDAASLLSTLLLIFELSIFIALTTLFSIFTTPFAGMIYSIIILYIGHSLDILKKAAEKAGGFSQYLANTVYYVFPNLEKFNIRNSITYGQIPNAGQLIYPIIYSVMYTVILLWLATLALKKQEL